MAYSVRSPRFGGFLSDSLPPGVKWLLLINVGIFVPYFLLQRTSYAQDFWMLALVPEIVIRHFGLWQLVTYLFLHGSITHILFNMLALYFFGTPLERDWGTRRFLRYYFLCGVGAALCDVFLNALWGHWLVRTIGASGAIYGLLLAFGVLYPNQTVFLYFLFPLRAKYMVMIVGAIAFLSAAADAGSNVSHIAHLGGMAFGFAYLKLRFADLRWIQREYQAWKLQRAKRKFQVYMRKQERSDRDRWVN
jgi:membrane associated rhomboid family serine protease